MADDSYSIKDVIEEFRRDTKDSLTRIEAQTIRTNGRVNSLEKSRIQIWTAISVVLAVGAVLYTLLLAHIDDKISKGMQLGLDNRVDSVKDK